MEWMLRSWKLKPLILKSSEWILDKNRLCLRRRSLNKACERNVEGCISESPDETRCRQQLRKPNADGPKHHRIAFSPHHSSPSRPFHRSNPTMRPTPHPPAIGDPDFPSSFWARIGLSDVKAEPTLAFLQKLIPHSTTRIPFESLQLHEEEQVGETGSTNGTSYYPVPPSQRRGAYSTPIDASISTIWRKINSGRGGYCFELNQTLFAALRALGFRDVVEYGGPVPYATESESSDDKEDASERNEKPWIFATAAHICRPGTIGALTHRVSIVGFPKQGSKEGDVDAFLVDIGYGSGAPGLPVPLDGRVVGSKYGRWRIVQGLWGEQYPDEATRADKSWLKDRKNWFDQLGRGWYLQSWLPKNFHGPSEETGFQWTTLYHFMPNPFFPPEFWQFNWFVSTFPEARFVAEEVSFRYLRARNSGTVTFSRTAEHRNQDKHGVFRLRWGGIAAELAAIEIELPTVDAPEEEEDEVPGLLKKLAEMEADGRVECDPKLHSFAIDSDSGKLAVMPTSDDAKWETLDVLFGMKKMATLSRK